MKILILFLVLFPISAQSLRIKSIQILDEGQLTSDFAYLVDTKRTECKTTTEARLEKFYDTLVQLEVVNDTDKNVIFTDFQIQLKDYRGRTFTSARRALTGNLEIASKSSTKFYGFLTKVSGNSKRLVNQKETIPEQLGVRNIEYSLFYVINKKKLGRISAKSATRFAEVNRCDKQ